MLYFVKRNLVHKFPVPKRCGATYDEQQLRDTKPHGARECVYCMHRWPSDEED